mgnify:CR=1 FL=1
MYIIKIYREINDFALKLGYEYEKNDNYENNNVRAGFSFLLGILKKK